jgi:hypothetical protein
VLDLADLELVPQLSMWDRADVGASVMPWDSNEAKCQRTRRSADPAKVYRTERGAWCFAGLITCEKWACAHCGSSRARSTSAALGVALRRHLSDGVRDHWRWPDAWMLTLTIPHTRTDWLGVTVDRLFGAWRSFEQSSAWRSFKKRWGVVGVVRVLDVTFGGLNGAHPHFHVLVLPSRAVRVSDVADVADAGGMGGDRRETIYQPIAGLGREERQLELDGLAVGLWGAWDDACAVAGVERARGAQALRLSGSEDAAAYFVGWGLGDEVGATPMKRRSHLRLLDAVAAHVAGAASAYVAWCGAVAGKQWVSGLGDVRRRLSISEEDEDAYIAELRAKRDAARAAAGDPVVLVRPLYGWVPHHLWPTVPRAGRANFFRALDAADARGEDVQTALVIWLSDQQRGRAPP